MKLYILFIDYIPYMVKLCHGASDSTVVAGFNFS